MKGDPVKFTKWHHHHTHNDLRENLQFHVRAVLPQVSCPTCLTNLPREGHGCQNNSERLKDLPCLKKKTLTAREFCVGISLCPTLGAFSEHLPSQQAVQKGTGCGAVGTHVLFPPSVMPLLFVHQDIKTSCSHNGYSWLGGGQGGPYNKKAFDCCWDPCQ